MCLLEGLTKYLLRKPLRLFHKFRTALQLCLCSELKTKQNIPSLKNIQKCFFFLFQITISTYKSFWRRQRGHHWQILNGWLSYGWRYFLECPVPLYQKPVLYVKLHYIRNIRSKFQVSYISYSKIIARIIKQGLKKPRIKKKNFKNAEKHEGL